MNIQQLGLVGLVNTKLGWNYCSVDRAHDEHFEVMKKGSFKPSSLSRALKVLINVFDTDFPGWVWCQSILFT